MAIDYKPINRWFHANGREVFVYYDIHNTSSHEIFTYIVGYLENDLVTICETDSLINKWNDSLPKPSDIYIAELESFYKCKPLNSDTNISKDPLIISSNIAPGHTVFYNTGLYFEPLSQDATSHGGSLDNLH